jgi:hypothetical protein
MHLSLCAALVAAASAGCSSGDQIKLVPVEGVVTLDGEPLADAFVIFQSDRGRPSVGTTGSDGRYRLQYTKETPGALPGRHQVTISTHIDPDSDTDDAERQAGRRERIPARYNSQTTLEAVVDAKGSEPADFHLESTNSP